VTPLAAWTDGNVVATPLRMCEATVSMFIIFWGTDAIEMLVTARLNKMSNNYSTSHYMFGEEEKRIEI
jgi:hypothetical protein